MGQRGFFDVERRLEAISAKGDLLETIKQIVPWEDCRRAVLVGSAGEAPPGCAAALRAGTQAARAPTATGR
jgi:hypothetical protein